MHKSIHLYSTLETTAIIPFVPQSICGDFY